jgi:hypothetical protein
MWLIIITYNTKYMENINVAVRMRPLNSKEI